MKSGAEQLRVLLCHPSAELYGSDRMALEAAVGLKDRGATVIVVLPVDGPLRRALEATGVKVLIRDVPVLRKSAMRPGGFVRLLADLIRSAPRAAATLREAEPDLVYVNTIVQPWWAFLARCLRRKVVIHVREAEPDHPAVIRRALMLPLRLAHSIISNSQFTSKQIAADCPAAERRSRVIYNGKDWSSYRLPHVDSTDETFRILFLGRLSPRKGTDVAVRALVQLQEQGFDARLTLAGAVFPGYEWYETELRELCAANGLDEHAVDFTGFVDRPHELFAHADALVVPSRAEPFGTVAAEGLAAGVPVVVSDVQGLLEIVRHDVDGLVVPVDDPVALAAALGRLIEDVQLRDRLVSEGQSSVEARFSREQYRAEVADEIYRAAALQRNVQ